MELMVELIMALYFFADSLKVFFDWYTADMNVRSHFVDTSFNVAAYAYQLRKVMRRDRSDDSDDGGLYGGRENYDSTKDEESDLSLQVLVGESV